MFGGSLNIPKYDEPLQMAGGENNAFTNNDYTNYYLTIPKNNLETAFWLESDRMLSLAFSEKSLNVQRQVVIEEFKQNYLNQPYGDVYMLLKPLAYKKHPYQWNTIGKEISHIEQATMEDVKMFYKKYYKPGNAILSVAGDVTAEQIKLLSEKWFAGIPNGEKLFRKYDEEPLQTKAREEVVERYVPQDAVYMAWHMPARKNPDFYVTDLISDILSNGNSSRLYQKMVKGKKMFSELHAFVTGDLDKGLFIVSGKLNPEFSRTEAVHEILEEINKLKTTLVETDELEKVKNKIEANHIFSRLSVLNKAMYLGYFEMLGDASLWKEETTKYNSVSREDIRLMAEKLFRDEGRNSLFYKALRS
jgi:predicted Zn-dependent peptidase